VLSLDPETAVPSGPPTIFAPGHASRNTLLAFSPDGSRIAWYLSLQGSPGQIWTADSDGSNAAALVIGLQEKCAPKWMPDGRSIRYLKGANPVTVWSVGVDDRLPRKVGEVALPTSWGELSPDGREIAFWKRTDGIANIWKTSLNGTPAVQLTSSLESLTFPFWSPDGKWLVVNLTRGENKHAAILPSSGGSITQLTDEPGITLATAWSPDSSKIVYAGYRQGVSNLYWVSRNTPREVRRLTNFRSSAAWVRTPVWSPKGSRIVYERMEVRGNIFVLDLVAREKATRLMTK